MARWPISPWEPQGAGGSGRAGQASQVGNQEDGLPLAPSQPSLPEPHLHLPQVRGALHIICPPGSRPWGRAGQPSDQARLNGQARVLGGRGLSGPRSVLDFTRCRMARGSGAAGKTEWRGTGWGWVALPRWTQLRYAETGESARPSSCPSGGLC